MMNNLMIVMPLVLFVSCGSIHPKPIAGPNGNEAYSMMCSGLSSNMPACLVKAQELCSQGFSIIEAETFTVEYADSGDGFYMHPREYLGIECKSLNT